jgi:DNA primase
LSPRYTADSRDRVRDAVDMLTLVESKVELRRAGVDSYFGRCPFHDENTASFHVRPDEKHYHCFGCSESGDAFDFVMQTEGLDFKGALESLAERFGVQLQTEDEDPAAAARRERRERLQKLLGRAATYYARVLWAADEARAARDYLAKRGLAAEVLNEFRVGYAPSGWDRLLLASRGAGYSEDELLAAGLAQRSHARPGQVYDRFRERIMFPSADSRGRVRGFGARAMRDNQQPKYLNSSEGELYSKRHQVFGIDFARASIAKSGRAVLVEGYTDVLALHQAGMRNAVGIMGTAFTEEQLGELERVASTLVLCLDSDAAGRNAMVKAAKLADGRKLELRVVPMPAGMDPADVIAAEGAGALRERVEASQPYVVFEVGRILDAADTRSGEGRDAALRELAPVVRDLAPGVLRDELVRKVSGVLGLSESRLAEAMAGARTASEVSLPQRSPAVDVDARAERTFLTLCVALPAAGTQALARIDAEHYITSDLWRRAAAHLQSRLEAPLRDLPPGDEELARAVADLVKRAGKATEVTADRLDHARLVLDLARLEREIRRARALRSGDVVALARARQAVKQEIATLVTKLEGRL